MGGNEIGAAWSLEAFFPAWKRKRNVVLKPDNWKCVYCGERATQVHHKRYAKKH